MWWVDVLKGFVLMCGDVLGMDLRCEYICMLYLK